MADEEIKVKITTETDNSDLDSLENQLKELKNQQLQIKIDANKEELEAVDKQLDELKRELESAHQLDIEVDPSAKQKIEELEREIRELENKRIDIKTEIVGDTTKIAKQLDETKTQAENKGKEAGERFGSGFKMMLSNFGAMVGFELFNQLTEATKASLNATSNLDYFANRMGLSAERTQEFNNNLDKLQKSYRKVDMTAVGATAEELSVKYGLAEDSLESLTETSAVLSSAFVKEGRTQEDAVLAVGDALDGQFKRLQEIGITQEDLMANGWNGDINDKKNLIDALNKSLEKKGFKQTAQDITDLDGAMQALQVAGGDLLAEVLIPLTPVIVGVVNSIISFIDVLKGMPDFAKIGLGVGVLSVAILLLGGYLYASVPAWIAQATAVWGNVTAFLALELPLGLTVGWLLLLIGIGIALGLAFLYLYNNCDWFRQGVDNLVATLQWLAGVIWGAITGAVQWVMGLFQNFTAQLGLNTGDWKQAVLGFILFLPTLPMQIGIALANAIAKALGFKGNFVQTLISSATSAVQGFASAIQGIPQALMNCLNWAVNIVMSHPLVQKLVWLGQMAADAFSKIGLGQSSPGKIVHAMEDELNWTEEAIEKSKLSKSTANLGSELSGSFNPKLSNIGSNGGATSSTTINIHVGSVDDKKRIDEIVEAVTQALKFDNKKAGRGV